MNIILPAGVPIPEGFVPGKKKQPKGSYAKFEYRWYTNGKEQKRLSILKGDVIPEGWWLGQSDAMRAKSQVAAKGKRRSPEQIEHHKEGCKKAWLHKLERGTFNKSSAEDCVYQFLIDIFKKENIFRQYNSDPRYPFHCDFYVSSCDLFIEINLFPTHGYEPFDEKNPEHQKLLSKYKNNPKDWVEEARAYTWADLDVRKRKIANQNHLNYICIYYDDYYKNNWKELFTRYV